MTELEVLINNFGSKEPYWIDEENLLHLFGEAQQVLLSAQILCPQVEVFRGAVFLRHFSFRKERIEKFLGDREITDELLTETEWRFNSFEVRHIFGTKKGQFELDEEDKVLAERLAATWRTWLPAQSPEHRFRVDVEPPEVTGSSYGVCFCVDRSGEQ